VQLNASYSVASFRPSSPRRRFVRLSTITITLLVAIWSLISPPTNSHLATGETKWKQVGLDGIDVHALEATDTLILAGTSEGIYRSLNDGLDWLPSQFGLPIAKQAQRTLSLLKMTESFIWAGTNGAGLWFGSGRAESWVYSAQTFPTRREKVMSLAANDRIAFAGTDGAGVFRVPRDSRYGSPVWRSSGLSGEKVSALATSGGRVFAGTLGNGMWVSIDNGVSWERSGRGLPANASIHTLVSQGKTLFAGATTGLWRSLDNGGKWVKVNLGATGNAPINAVLPKGANIYVGTGGGGVLISIDDGKTWKAFNDGLTNQYILSLVNHRGRLYAGTKGGGIFMKPLVAEDDLPPIAKSQTITLDEDTGVPINLFGEDPEDKPVTFKIVNWPQKGFLTGDAPNLEYKPAPDFFGADSFSFLAHDGKNSSRVATVTLIVKPVDDHLNLTIEGNENAAVGDFVVLSVRGFNPDGGKVKVSVKSLPNGAAFESQNDPFPNLAKWVPTNEGIYTFSFTATHDNGETLTKDFKVNVTARMTANGWEQIPLFTDKYAREILIASAGAGEVIYITADGEGSDRSAVLLRSTDNGRAWTRIGNGLTSIVSLPIVNSGKALFASASKSIFRSTDGGLNWVDVTRGKGLGNGNTGFSISAQGDKALAWSSHKVYLSVNAGESWSDATGNLPIGLPDAPIFDSRNIMDAAVSGEALLVSLNTGPIPTKGPFTFRSTDNGANWETANKGLEGLSSISKFIVDGANLYGVMAMSTHHSNDHGASWRVTNPLFTSHRQGISPNTHVAARKGMLVVMYGDGSIFSTRDNGGAWMGIDRMVVEEIAKLAVGNSSLFAITRSGKLFSRPIK